MSLRGGRLVRLVGANSKGLIESKWCRNRGFPFLVIDPEPDPAPGARDAEERTLRFSRVPVGSLRALMEGGEMLMPSIVTLDLGLRWLRREGLLPPEEL